MPVFRTVRQAFTRPQAAAEADVERQQAHPLESTAAPDAAQHARATPSQPLSPLSLLTSLPLFASSAGGRTRQDTGSSPRPTSSRYSDAADDNGGSPAEAVLSPKTPEFSASPADFPLGATAGAAPIAVPPTAAVNAGEQGGRRHRRWFRGADPAEVHLADLADAGRRRRQRRQEERGNNNQQPEGPPSSSSTEPTPTAPPPAAVDTTETAASTTQATTATNKRFLFCFPAVRSRRMRAHILRCCVSGLFVVLMLAVYGGLSATHNVTNSQFSVLLVLVLVAAAVVFVHSLVRLAMGLAHPPSAADEAAAEARYQLRRTGRGGRGTVADGPAALGFGQHYAAGGYALPRQPIRVVLARDEEIAGAASEAAKLQPPAYGLWRESVRVDPNRLYWQRNDTPPALGAIQENPTAGRVQRRSSSSSSGDRESVHGRSSPRPPSYASDDGVRYVVEAQPRSIAPTTDVPLPPHPAEAGRTAAPVAW